MNNEIGKENLPNCYIKNIEITNLNRTQNLITVSVFTKDMADKKSRYWYDNESIYKYLDVLVALSTNQSISNALTNGAMPLDKKKIMRRFRRNKGIVFDSKKVRSQSNWQRTKNVLKESVSYGLVTKTGLMVGLGENDDEVLSTMQEMADIGVEIINIGQYLQPSKNHLPVERFVHPNQFKMFKEEGVNMGFKVIESGPLVRSSYHAEKQVNIYNDIKWFYEIIHFSRILNVRL